MPSLIADAMTPSYVLRDGSQPIGPFIVHHDSGLISSVIYCFSSKRTYDVFSAASPLVLTPYPLVKGFLQSRVDDSCDGLQLLAIDAVGPLAPCLYAAKMECVLAAIETKTKYVNAGYVFRFDQEAVGYRLVDATVSTAEPIRST